MKKLYSFLVVLVCLCFSKAHAQTANPDFHDGLLSFKTLVDSSVSLPLYPYEGTYPYMDSLISKYGVTHITKTFGATEDEHLSGCYTVQFDSIHLVDSFVQDIKRYGFIEFVSKRPIKRPFASPNDPKYNLQWALHKIMADSVWNLLPGTGKEIILAVIDDAVLLDHEEFNGLIDNPGEDIADFDTDVNPLNPTDIYFSHGTHVAGIALGKTNNSKGIASLNYNGNIKLLPIKVAHDADPSYLVNTPQAIDYAGTNGAKVVNMSFGSPYPDPFDSLALAQYPNVIFVAAAGNTGTEIYNYPASYNLPNIISVGATNQWDEIADLSSFNDRIDVMAPGVGILSSVATDTNAYMQFSGTSMAAPLVASLFALLWSYDSTLTTQEVIDRVLNAADTMIISNSAHHGKVGKGRINAYRTLNPSFPNYSAAFRITNGKNHCTGSQTNFEAIAYPGLQYFWYFGDGSTDSTSGYLCQHTFSNAGNFTIKLILKDSVTAAPVAEQTYKNYIFIYDCNPIFSKHGNWYFGEYAGLNFANGYPEPDTTPVFMSEFKTRSGTISISNDSGNIEFYCGYYFNPASIFTNRPIVIGGDHVKQREIGDYFYLGGNQNVAYLSFGDLHYLFLGSNDLFGTPPPLGFYSFSLAQDRTINPLSSLQVVKPNNPNINFQDTTDFEGGILTNQNLITIPGCDSIYWIVTQGFAPNLAHAPLHSSQLLVIKVQMIGGQVHTKLNQAYSLPGSIGTPNLKAYFTSSPDGNFVARINDPVFNSYQSSTDVFKFDKQTGMLEFYKRLRYGAGGGLCFSPSGRFLYVVNGSTLVQYDLSLEHPDDYPTFNELDNNNGCGMLQLGPDGKILSA